MPAELQALVGLTWTRARIAENRGAVGDQPAGADEIGDRAASLVMRIELKERFGPEAPAGIQGFDFLVEFVRADASEGTGEGRVLAEQVVV